VVLVLVGLVLLVAAGVGWSLEKEYGGDPDRAEYVIGHDAQTGQATVQGQEGMVYEASNIADAEAYVESQRGSRNYTVSILLLTGGVLAIIAGIAPSPLARESRPASRTELMTRP
jgi:hypothetical protein